MCLNFVFETWNIRTVLQAVAMNIIAEEILKYHMAIAAIQEIRSKCKGVVNKKD